MMFKVIIIPRTVFLMVPSSRLKLRVIMRVHPVRVMSAKQRQMAADRLEP